MDITADVGGLRHAARRLVDSRPAGGDPLVGVGWIAAQAAAAGLCLVGTVELADLARLVDEHDTADV